MFAANHGPQQAQMICTHTCTSMASAMVEENIWSPWIPDSYAQVYLFFRFSAASNKHRPRIDALGLINVVLQVCDNVPENAMWFPSGVALKPTFDRPSDCYQSISSRLTLASAIVGVTVQTILGYD